MTKDDVSEAVAYESFFGVVMERWEISSQKMRLPKSCYCSASSVIYGMGDRSVLQAPCMSVVELGRATPYGMAIAEMAGRCAADNNIGGIWRALGCIYTAGMSALNAGGNRL